MPVHAVAKIAGRFSKMEIKIHIPEMKTLLAIAGIMFSLLATAQSTDKKSVVIGSLTEKPNALLIVNPQNSDQGVLMPQLSTGQRTAMKPSSPSEDGLMV